MKACFQKRNFTINKCNCSIGRTDSSKRWTSMACNSDRANVNKATMADRRSSMGDCKSTAPNYDEPPYSRLFIIGSKQLAEEDFRGAFSKFGEIEEIWVVKDRQTGERKGETFFLFVFFSTRSLRQASPTSSTRGPRTPRGPWKRWTGRWSGIKTDTLRLWSPAGGCSIHMGAPWASNSGPVLFPVGIRDPRGMLMKRRRSCGFSLSYPNRWLTPNCTIPSSSTVISIMQLLYVIRRRRRVKDLHTLNITSE